MVRIMADIAADIPVEFVKEHNMKILPFYINVEDESILADINYMPEEFYELVKTSETVPKTSQCPPAIVEEYFRELSKDGESVIFVTISANASGTNNTANMIASQLNEDEGFDITVVNSKSFSLGIGKPVMDAVLMAEKGAGKEEILSFLNEAYERDTAYFVVDDLSYLKKGGRIKASSAIIGDLLDIKPVLYINDGLVEVYAKVRGIKKAISKLIDEVAEKMDNPEEGEILVLDADAKDKSEFAVKLLEKKFGSKNISVHKVGTIITAHAGVGVMGIYFKHKKK